MPDVTAYYMCQLKILSRQKDHISAADSIKTACQCGWQRIQVDFSDWTPAEREYLASCVKDDEGASLNVSVAPPTAEQLRVWVGVQLAEIAREEEAKKAQAAADVEAVRDGLDSEGFQRRRCAPFIIAGY